MHTTRWVAFCKIVKIDKTIASNREKINVLNITTKEVLLSLLPIDWPKSVSAECANASSIYATKPNKTIYICTVSYTHLTLPTNREV